MVISAGSPVAALAKFMTFIDDSCLAPIFALHGQLMLLLKLSTLPSV